MPPLLPRPFPLPPSLLLIIRAVNCCRLRKDHGIYSGVPVLLSIEKPTCKLLPIEEVTGEAHNPLDFQVLAAVPEAAASLLSPMG